MLHLVDNIVLIRKLLGDNQEAFAKRFSNVSLGMQKSYERGTEPSLLYLQELADLSGVSQNDLANKSLRKDDIAFSSKDKKGRKVDEDRSRADDYQQKYYEVLERERKALEEDKAFFKEVFKSSLIAIREDVRAVMARQKGTGDVVLNSLERLEKKEIDSLVDEADRRIYEIDKEVHRPGNESARRR